MGASRRALLRCTIAAALLQASGVGAQDLAREQRLREQIVDAILDGEPLDLEANGRPFLAIYTETEADVPRGAVILVHGRGYHPDWADVVGPMRVTLAERGWHTLSLQMPVLAKDAKYYDYVPILPAAFPRIDAALAFLEEKGLSRPVLLAHSCGVHMAMAYVERFGDGSFAAFVGVGMGATDYKQPMRKPFPLATMGIPVLDVFGGNDHPGVKRNAQRRAAAARSAGHPHSQQLEVPGADHEFRGKQGALIEIVSQWLEKTPMQVQ